MNMIRRGFYGARICLCKEGIPFSALTECRSIARMVASFSTARMALNTMATILSSLPAPVSMHRAANAGIVPRSPLPFRRRTPAFGGANTLRCGFTGVPRQLVPLLQQAYLLS